MKNIIGAVCLSFFALAAFAQSGTNSPYSMYGYGVLSDQGNSFSRGMNGVGISLQRNNQVNYLNPASYASIDSMTFVFDAGMSIQNTNFKEGNVSRNAKNADFEYVVAGLKLHKKLGLGFGILPYSNVGYNFTSTKVELDREQNTTTTEQNTFSGSGGIHQAFVGLGWATPVKGLSVGANVGYFWGDMSRSVTTSYSDTYVSTLTKNYSTTVSSYKVDFGAQYQLPIDKDNSLSLGVSYSLGHKLGADPMLTVRKSDPQNSVSDTTTYMISDGIELPSQIGIGLSWMHKNSLNVAFDYTMMNTDKVAIPVQTGKASDTKPVSSSSTYGSKTAYTNDAAFASLTGQMNARHKFNLGAEWCQNPEGRSFASRIRYRLGASYTTPYLKINGADGPREIAVSAGFGIPIVNGWNNRSILNISAQWVNLEANNMIRENTFRINVGLTFNERWFAKWKFE